MFTSHSCLITLHEANTIWITYNNQVEMSLEHFTEMILLFPTGQKIMISVISRIIKGDVK